MPQTGFDPPEPAAEVVRGLGGDLDPQEVPIPSHEQQQRVNDRLGIERRESACAQATPHHQPHTSTKANLSKKSGLANRFGHDARWMKSMKTHLAQDERRRKRSQRTFASMCSVRDTAFPNSAFRIRIVDGRTLYELLNAGNAGVMIGIKCDRSRGFSFGFQICTSK